MVARPESRLDRAFRLAQELARKRGADESALALAEAIAAELKKQGFVVEIEVVPDG